MSDGDTLHWKHDNKKTDTYNLPESLVYTSGPLELDGEQYKANRIQMVQGVLVGIYGFQRGAWGQPLLVGRKFNETGMSTDACFSRGITKYPLFWILKAKGRVQLCAKCKQRSVTSESVTGERFQKNLLSM